MNRNSNLSQIESGKLYQRVRSLVLYHTKGEIRNQQTIEDLIQDVLLAICRPVKNQDNPIRFPRAYIVETTKNIVRNFLKKQSKQKAGQFENDDDPEDLSKEKNIEEVFEIKELSSKSILQRLEEERPDFYNSLVKSIEYVGLLYFLKENRARLDKNVFPFVRTINALKEAKAKIDVLAKPLPSDVMRSLRKKYRKIRPLPPGRPDYFDNINKDDPMDAMESLRRAYENIKPYPKQLENFNRDYFFYIDVGKKISTNLKLQIQELINKIQSECLKVTFPISFFSRHLEDIVQLDDWIIDAIPQLRANPSMLLLRVFYQIFKMRAGKYSARTKIKEILLEFAERNRETYLQFYFEKINENTNFETLRKKLYQKGARTVYDKLANYIYSRCFLQS